MEECPDAEKLRRLLEEARRKGLEELARTLEAYLGKRRKTEGRDYEVEDWESEAREDF